MAKYKAIYTAIASVYFDAETEEEAEEKAKGFDVGDSDFDSCEFDYVEMLDDDDYDDEDWEEMIGTRSD